MSYPLITTATTTNNGSTTTTPRMTPKSKEEQIKEVLSQPEIDLWKLRDFCISEGGLLNDSLRTKAWPKLVGIDSQNSTIDDNTPTTDITPKASPNRTNHKSSKRNINEQPQSKRQKPKEIPSKASSSRLPPRRMSSSSSLMGSEAIDVTNPYVTKSKNQTVAKCLDFDQIGRDVTRCTWHLLTGTQRSRRRQIQNKHRRKVASVLRRKQCRLGNFINLVLIQSYGECGTGIGSDGDTNTTSVFDNDDSEPEVLRYYQGYHDVSSIFLGTLGGTNLTSTMTTDESTTTPEYNYSYSMDDDDSSINRDPTIRAADRTARALGLDLPSRVLLRISTSHFRDSLKNDFRTLSSALRLFVLPLVQIFDPDVHDHLVSCGMEPFFALSWIITWFSHDVRDTALVKRLFDFFIVSHPLMPLYASLAMVCHPYNREEVLGAECDFSSVHKALSQLPRNSCSDGYKFVGAQTESEYVSDDEKGFGGGGGRAGGSVGGSVGGGGGGVVDGTNLVREMGRTLERKDTFEGEEYDPPSLASSSLFTGGEGAAVPFEEILELAIEFIERIPPRRLLCIANHYYQNSSPCDVDPSTIALLHQPPPWTYADSALSDRSLKKRASQSRLRDGTAIDPPSSSKSKPSTAYRRRQRPRPPYERLIAEWPKKGIPYRTLVATGNGRDGDGERRRRRRRRKRAWVAAGVVGVVAVVSRSLDGTVVLGWYGGARTAVVERLGLGWVATTTSITTTTTEEEEKEEERIRFPVLRADEKDGSNGPEYQWSVVNGGSSTSECQSNENGGINGDGKCDGKKGESGKKERKDPFPKWSAGNGESSASECQSNGDGCINGDSKGVGKKRSSGKKERKDVFRGLKSWLKAVRKEMDAIEDIEF